jgi:predicted transcriptional regulator
MPKAAVFTMKLDAALRAEFMAEAANEDRPASQVVRELMRGYIVQRRQARTLQEAVLAGYHDAIAGRVFESSGDFETDMATLDRKEADGWP